MKRYVFLLSCLCMAMMASAQFSIGMRDTRHVNVGYTCRDHYFVQLEQSIYSEKIQYQYARLYVGCKWDILPSFHVEGKAYYGMAWNNYYRNLGLQVSGSYRWKFLQPYAVLNPHYDSYYDFQMLYRGGAAFHVTRQLAVKCDYTTIPAYRESEKRVRLGLGIGVENLYVEPMCSVPAEGDNKMKSWRVELSLNYIFK